MDQHKDLKDQALIDAVQQQNWDPSVQALAVLPDVVKLLANDIKWTTDLGNAFLAQQSDVMEAVQRMRAKAQKNGNLKSNDKMKVETKTVEKETVVVIEQVDPQVVYVPSYNPTVVYGPAPYPYPAIAYPPPGAYVAGAMISFGVGVMVGAAFHGGWGYNCGWGGAHNNVINVNHNNNFVRTSNVRAGVQPGAGNRGQWQHNPQHRGGAPYGNQATASRYGGTAPRDTSRAQQAGGGRAQAGGDRQQAGGGDRGAKRQPAAEGRAGADRAGADRARRGDRAAQIAQARIAQARIAQARSRAPRDAVARTAIASGIAAPHRARAAEDRGAATPSAADRAGPTAEAMLGAAARAAPPARAPAVVAVAPWRWWTAVVVDAAGGGNSREERNPHNPRDRLRDRLLHQVTPIEPVRGREGIRDAEGSR